MPTSIGNLAIIISGNAKPFNNTLKSVNNTINQWSAGTQNWINIHPPRDPSSYLQWGSFGRLIRSALVMGVGGGLAGALVGVAAMAFGQMLEAAIGFAHRITDFLKDAFEEGLKISRMELGVNFLAGGLDRGAEWLKSLRDLSQTSGYEMAGLGQSMRTLAGSTDELENVVPLLKSLTTISAGLGAETEQMNRFALAVSQVLAAGRFEAQEINQLTEAGMPIKELAKTAGMSVGRFRAQVKDGSVAVSVLAETLNRMTGPGGRFFGMLEERAKSGVGMVDKMTASWLLFKQELGKDMIQAGKDSGLFATMQGGIEYLIKNKGEVIGFLSDGASMIYEWSRAGIMFAGNMYDIAKGVMEITRAFLHAMKTIDKYAQYLNPTRYLNRFLINKGAPELGDFFMPQHGTGEKWLSDLDLFLFNLRNKVKPAVQDAFEPIHVALSLSPRLQKLFEGLADRMREGITPWQKFQTGLSSLKQRDDFTRMKMAEGQYGLQSAPLIDDRGNRLSGFERGWIEAGMLFKQIMSVDVLKPNERDQFLADNFLELEKSLNMATDKFPAAMSKGSQEAASAIAHAMYGSENKSIQERILASIQVAKTAQEQTAANTKAIAAAMARLNGNPIMK